jgi:hypothetical protein
MKKVCSTCGKNKPLELFYKSKNRKDGYAYSCKQCANESNKDTRDKYQERYQEYRNDYKRNLTQRINDYKMDKGCVSCGEKSHPAVLDMHHLDPTIKEDSPSSLRTSWDRWIEEAQKCIVLCANCHRKVHAGILKV